MKFATGRGNVVITLLFVPIIVQDGNQTFAVAPDSSSVLDECQESTSQPPTVNETESNADLGKKGDNHFKLPDDLKPYDDQLAGRRVINTANGEKLCVLIDTEGNLWKPDPNENEISFYEILAKATHDDHLLKELTLYVPSYLGIVKREIYGEVVTFIRIGDVMKGFESRCSMDLKIGRVRRPPNAPQQSASKKLKYQAMMNEFGFAIPGFKYHNVIDGVVAQKGRDLGFRMLPHEGIQALYNFVNGEIGIKSGLVDNILAQLREIRSWFQRQRRFRFFDSSILLTYDAKHLSAVYQLTKKNDEEYKRIANEINDDSQNDEVPSIPTRVRMIDFGYVVPHTGDEEDVNYLFGLNNLIDLFENLAERYAKTLEQPQVLLKN